MVKGYSAWVINDKATIAGKNMGEVIGWYESTTQEEVNSIEEEDLKAQFVLYSENTPNGDGFEILISVKEAIEMNISDCEKSGASINVPFIVCK